MSLNPYPRARLSPSSTLTMGKIADLAGVSKSTVSLALRNSSKIQKQTCQKIQAIAREMNYRPNPLVSAQMVHIRHNTHRKTAPAIGFLNIWDGRTAAEEFDSKQMRNYYHGAKERAASFGFTVDLLEFDRAKYSDRRVQIILHSRNIEGLILAPTKLSTHELELNWSEYTLSAIGCFSGTNGIHRFFYDSFHCMQDVMDILGTRAYSRVGLVTNQRMEVQSGHLLSGGYLEYQSRVILEGFRVPLLQLSNTEAHYTAGQQLKISEWIKANRPDAIIGIGVNLSDLLRSQGLRMPEDIGYVALGWGGSNLDDCAGYHLNEEKVGAAAVDSLIMRMYQNERGLPTSPITALMYGDFVEGKTLRGAMDMAPFFKAR
jgi:LacI family transcriptional regulator